MQAERISASVSTSATGRVAPDGRLGPVIDPVERLTAVETELKALARPTELVGLVPRLEYEDIKRDNAHTDATVVNSLTEMNVDVLRFPHGPKAAITASAVLFVPTDRPGLPPWATR